MIKASPGLRLAFIVSVHESVHKLQSNTNKKQPIYKDF